MTIWRYVRTSLGDTGIAVVVLVTLATALVAGLIAPRLIPASERADARVSITQVTGSRASYELATFVADFQAALTSEQVLSAAARGAGAAQGGADTALTTERLGDSSTVLVSYVAGSGKAADAGLRAAVRAALTGMVNDARRRSNLELRAALSRQASVLSSVDKAQTLDEARIPKAYRQRSRDFMVERAAEGVADAAGQSVLVQTEADSLDSFIRTQRVSLQRLPTTAAQVRIVLAASGTAFLLAVGGVLVARRRWPVDDPSLRKARNGGVGGRHARAELATAGAEREDPSP
jgi:hypothetical protein